MKTTIGVSDAVFVDEVNRLNTNVKLLLDEVNAKAKDSPDIYMDILKGLHSLGKRIYLFDQNLSVLDTLDAQAWDRLQQFKMELNEWRSRYVDLGNSTASVPMAPQKAPESNIIKGFFGSIPWWVYGGVAIAGLLLFMPEPPRSHHKQS